MQLEKLPEGSIVISNANFELVFDEETRLLSSVKDKRRNLTKEIKLKFGGYPTVQFRNGAYLFKPDANREPVAVIDPIGKSFEHEIALDIIIDSKEVMMALLLNFIPL